jgi:hypothetical protein
MSSPKNTSKNLRWALLIHRGKGMHELFFKENKHLKYLFQERGIFWLSPLNRPHHGYFINERNAFISYLMAYYPHFKNLSQKTQNEVVSNLLKRFENEDYVEIIWRELNIQGNDGGYVVLFDGHQATVKYIGLGNWEESELVEFVDSDQFDTPEKWLIVDNDWYKSRSIVNRALPFEPELPEIQKYYLDPADSNTTDGIEPHWVENSESSLLLKVQSPEKNEVHQNLNWIHLAEGRTILEEHELVPTFEKLQVLMNTLGEEIPQELQIFLLQIQEYGLTTGLFQFLDILGSKLPSLANGNSGMISLMAGKDQAWAERMAPNIMIDINYNIHFSDEAGELILEPLHKALYIFFLRNLNGINLSDLYLHKNDILEYYRMLSKSENIERMTKSVNQLVDVRENSIHEKISKINRSIRKLFKEANTGVDPTPYLIAGPKGDAKRILISAAKVMWV